MVAHPNPVSQKGAVEKRLTGVHRENSDNFFSPPILSCHAIDGLLFPVPAAPVTPITCALPVLTDARPFCRRRGFYRSFATRGSNGGCPRLFEKASICSMPRAKEVIFVETIGVGQDQLEIAALTHMVVVVLTAQMGDEVQGMKAGLAEIADILVVNKADLAGADETVQQLEALFADEDFHIVATSAIKNQKIDRLVECIEQHRKESVDNGRYQSKRLDFCRQELLSLLREKVFAELAKKIADDSLETQVKMIAERQKDPYSAVEEIAKRIGI